MAEAYFRTLCKDLGLTDVETRSAGLAAPDGAPPSQLARSVLAEACVDLGRASSRPVSPALVDWADLVVAMTREHERRIIADCPQARAKTRTLLSFSGSTGDISDPFGGDRTEYAACLAAMKPALVALAQGLAGDADGQ